MSSPAGDSGGGGAFPYLTSAPSPPSPARAARAKRVTVAGGRALLPFTCGQLERDNGTEQEHYDSMIPTLISPEGY